MDKLIIAGCRDSTDYGRAREAIDGIVERMDADITLICGMARGADMLGHRYATEAGWPIEEYPADWDRYGKRAGPIRNGEMARAATHLIPFWDGQSRGTANMIARAQTEEVDVVVVRID